MAEAAHKQLERHDDCDAFLAGAAEVMIAWQEDGIWFRSLIDCCTTICGPLTIIKPLACRSRRISLGCARRRQAGTSRRRLSREGSMCSTRMVPAAAGFVSSPQETDKPYALTTMHMTEHWLTMGRKQVDAAISIWRRCIESGKWPGYPHHAIQAYYPIFREKQWLERELSGEFDPTVLMAG